MKYINLGKSNLSVSAVAAGCMGYGGGWSENGATFETDKKDEAGFFAAIDNGINLFDVADIYGCGGRSEESLGNLINKIPGLRRKIIVQSKCGIRHPANIQPVVGSRTPERIKSAATASQIHLTREEWYGMYFSVKGKKQP